MCKITLIAVLFSIYFVNTMHKRVRRVAVKQLACVSTAANRHKQIKMM